MPDEGVKGEAEKELKRLALVMFEALAIAAAVRSAVEERDPAMKPLIDAHYKNLVDSKEGKDLHALFESSDEGFLKLLQQFQSKQVN